MQRVPADIRTALQIGPDAPDAAAWDADGARPAPLWDPSAGTGPAGGVNGGVNYGPDDP